MREIKFRAWDTRKNTWMTADEIMGRVLVNPSWDGKQFQLDEKSDKGFAKDIGYSFELMQYTGLHDKNGKEIYEGDIVQSVALSNDHHQRGATSLLSVKYFMGNPCLCFHGYDSGVPIYPFCVNHTLEIVGNIYENAEIIEPTESLSEAEAEQ